MKECYKCKLKKELQYFGKDKSKKDGLLIYCKQCSLSKHRRWRAKNKEKTLTYAKNYRERNKSNPEYKKKKTAHDKAYREKNREKIKLQQLETRSERLAKRRKRNRDLRVRHPEIFLIESSKARAKKKNLEHTLTTKDIKIPDTCPVLGIPIVVGSGRPHYNSPSLDRIDSKKGYIKENIIVVSWRANDLKRDATIEEMKKLYYFYKDL